MLNIQNVTVFSGMCFLSLICKALSLSTNSASLTASIEPFSSFIDELDATAYDVFLKNDSSNICVSKNIISMRNSLSESLLRSVHTIICLLFKLSPSANNGNSDKVYKTFINYLSNCVHDFCGIYDIMYTTKDISNLNVSTKLVINKRIKVDKYIGRYNTSLNRIKQTLVRLKDSSSPSTLILACHQLISDIPLFDKKIRLRDIVNRPIIIISCPIRVSRPKRHINYDGARIDETYNCVVKLGSRYFGFFDSTEMLCMIRSAIDRTTIDSLDITRNISNSITSQQFGSVIHFGNTNTQFSLKLYFQHGLNDSVLVKSTNAKLLVSLSGEQWMTPKRVQQLGLLSRGQPIVSDFPYINIILAQYLIVERIHQLINIRRVLSAVRSEVPIFEFISCECTRSSCQTKHIYIDETSTKNSIQCNGCNINSFCNLCSELDHTGKCYYDIDTQLPREYKYCPSCSILVYKDFGSNDIRCSRCSTYFCWSCETIYDTPLLLMEHYQSSNCTP